MGHIRLGTLPMTLAWRRVVELLGSEAGAASVAAAAAEAAHEGLDRAKTDPGLVEAFWLLTQVPHAAKEHDFEAALKRRGLEVPSHPSLVDLTTAISERIDERVRAAPSRNDLSEMAQLAAVEALHDVVGKRLPRLFESRSDLQREVARLATVSEFGRLARVFFARLTERYLNYYLSRELSLHVGSGERFGGIDDHTAFNDAMRRHCIESARIVEDFAGQWLSKVKWEGRLTRRATQGFAHVAFRKLNAELRRRESARGD